MTKRIQTYEADEITVTFDPNRCIHSEVCIHSLPAVFDLRRKRWIRPDAASAEAVADAIRRCPSGALQFRLAKESGTDGSTVAAAPAPRVRLTPDGPLVVDGPVTILREDGTTVERDGTVALCRCGGSRDKPFCDGSHARLGFRSTERTEGG